MLWYDSHAQRLRRVAPAWKARAEIGQTDAIPPHYAEELQKRIVGTVVLPGDPDYDRDRLLTNPRFSAFPQVIVYCEVENDVAECIHVARALSLPVVVRSGGHSTGGFSSQDGFLIDVSRMNEVVVDPANLSAWVGPGTNFRKFNAKLQYFDLHTPGGACADVCIGGYMQGGGYGFTARMFGMNCDQVQAVRLMLADGRMVDADENTNSDLFWAVRGGTGSNFGVLLAVKYRLYKGNDFAGFSIVWSMNTDEEAANAARALAWLQEHFMRTGAPDNLGYQMIWAFEGPVTQPKEPMLLMRGMYRGPTEELETILKPVLDLPGSTLQALYDPQPYTDLNRILLSEPYEVPEFPADMVPMPPPEAKLSRYLARPLAASDWLGLIDYFRTSPSPYTIAAMEIYGGAIAAVGCESNAFIHRDVYCDLFFDVFWVSEDERETMLSFLEGWEKRIAPYWCGRVYQNYPTPKNQNFGENYWGERYALLRAIKTKYDPGNLFRYPQSIALLEEPLDSAVLPELSGPIAYCDGT
ncbi:FAD-dependent oxidoreductase (plasmid) [Sinorhizobium americanum CCGM7]|uniref:FAD-binding oxidoreductase n=1 Tax=Sinorhizobium americanum TaxID=194963 RepID=UPI0004DA0CF6|nr:FAD-binding oxidoreductase [Sinorhizobium americanum]APG88026.1 FAD-dependent oxidoreductase [Sinorhizobium americanum CCGM7]